MESSSRVDEGTLAVGGGVVAYRRFNAGRGVPLLVIHGGPGAGHRYLKRLGLIADQREVIFYDQLGSGRSPATTDDASLWSIDRFVDEIAAVRDALGLDEVHLFGHSAGGWLVIDYLLRDPQGVRSAILANTAASMPDFSQGVASLVEKLPPETRHVIAAHAHDVWSTDESYLDAIAEFYARHIVRDRHQARLLLEAQRTNATYTTMLGPHELAVVGNLREWDRSSELSHIATPSLVIAGGRDHNTPECARRLADGLVDSTYVQLDECGHDPINQAPETVLTLMRTFLSRHDGEPRK